MPYRQPGAPCDHGGDTGQVGGAAHFPEIIAPAGAPTAPHQTTIPAGAKVLLLNASFEPLTVVTAKRAVVLMLSGKAECVQAALSGAAFRSESLSIPAPSVMRLSRYVRVPYRRAVPMTRAGVLRRDLRRCAYCGKKADTIDHIVPRSRGGGHTWENCVAACRGCNSRKADHLLEELGWSLSVVPKPPNRAAGGVLLLTVEPHPTWEPYLNQLAA